MVSRRVAVWESSTGRAQGKGLGLGFRIQGLGFMIHSLGFRIQGLGFRS